VLDAKERKYSSFTVKVECYPEPENQGKQLGKNLKLNEDNQEQKRVLHKNKSPNNIFPQKN